MMSKKPSGVPESDRILHTKFILKRTKRRSGVVGPVTPSAAREAVLDTVVVKCTQKRLPKTRYHLPGTESIFIMVYCFANTTYQAYKPFMWHGAWKNIPMMAIIASLPLASSAESFFVFSAGSLEVSTLKPKSPAAAGVPGD